MALSTIRPRSGRHGHGLLEGAVFGLDGWLRRRNGVIEYSSDPRCVLRIQLDVCGGSLVLADGVRLAPADRVINLHFWNEQLPTMGRAGPTLGWARAFVGGFEVSLLELARFLAARRDLDDVAAIRGNVRIGTAAQKRQLARIFGHFGFEPAADARARSFGRTAHRLGENLLGAMLVLARNPAALRPEVLWRDELCLCLSRQAFDRRYAFRAPPASAGAAAPGHR